MTTRQQIIQLVRAAFEEGYTHGVKDYGEWGDEFDPQRNEHDHSELQHAWLCSGSRASVSPCHEGVWPDALTGLADDAARGEQ